MAPEGKQYKQSRLPALRAGQYVLCTGKVLGGNGDGGAVLVAFAQARETSKAAELRRFGVVAFADELRLCVLMDQQEGWIQLPETRSEVSSEELQALLAKVPEFLGNLPKVTTLQTKFSRLMPPAQPLRPRSQRAAAVGASSAEADAETAQASAQNASKAPPPSLSFDLKGVQVGRLRALSEGQLLELCNERQLQLASDAGAPQMLQALLQFRNREGRTRRASGSSSGRGGRRIFDDDDDGGDLAGDNDEATQREHEREQERKRKREQERKQTREQEREQKREQERKHKKKKNERTRTPSPVPSSSGSGSGSRGNRGSGSDSDTSSRHTPKHRKLSSPASSASTPWEVQRAREELAAAEAARLARLREKVDRHERRRDEQQKRKRHSRKHLSKKHHR